MRCFWCRIFGHKYYKGLASWVCTRSCCQGKGKLEGIIPAPRHRVALAWWDPDKPRRAEKSLDCLDGRHDTCDESGGCRGCSCHWLED